MPNNPENPENEKQTAAPVKDVIESVWRLAQVAGIVLFAVLSFVCARIYSTVEENGLTLARVKTVQDGVVTKLDKMDTEQRLTISRAEHDALSLRVTTGEKDVAEIKAKMEILLHEKSLGIK